MQQIISAMQQWMEIYCTAFYLNILYWLTSSSSISHLQNTQLRSLSVVSTDCPSVVPPLYIKSQIYWLGMI